MLHVLINAYAVSPDWGSEQGVGWNWVTSIAKYCKVDVITEAEYRDRVEEVVSTLSYRDNIKFHFIPVSERVRRMCWNQGDYRFYFYYSAWQRKALKLARRLISEQKFDVIHMLNMVGYREPGLLWKIKGIPYVWGPMAGASMIPLKYFSDAPFLIRVGNLLKNAVNRFQFYLSPRVKSAIKHSDVIITPIEEMADMIKRRYGKDAVIIPETGLNEVSNVKQEIDSGSSIVNLLWVGRFVARKQLNLAIQTLGSIKSKHRFRLNIVGFGRPSEDVYYKALASNLGVAELCVWYGKQPNDVVYNLMRSSDLLFFTSVMEATSTVVPEAISCRLPILCHDTCGFGPLVDESVGWKIPLSSPEDSVKNFAAILDVIASSGTKPRDQKDGFDRVAEQLTYESKAKKVVEIYNNLISE